MPGRETDTLPEDTASAESGNSYRCQWCRAEWVVPSLARSCEAKCGALR